MRGQVRQMMRPQGKVPGSCSGCRQGGTVNLQIPQVFGLSVSLQWGFEKMTLMESSSTKMLWLRFGLIYYIRACSWDDWW